jgi:hypothetical protein
MIVCVKYHGKIIVKIISCINIKSTSEVIAPCSIKGKTQEDKQEDTKCAWDTQMPLKVANSTDSHAYVKACLRHTNGPESGEFNW